MKLRNILIGMGSLLDLCPARDVRSITLNVPAADDTAALRKDWEAVGNDMRTVMGKEIDDA